MQKMIAKIKQLFHQNCDSIVLEYCILTFSFDGSNKLKKVKKQLE